jgi:Family of unknown function (DUF6492)
MKAALITPTYAPDRQILDISCEQVDRFCEGEIDHYIIPSRSDKMLFQHLQGRHRHIVCIEELFDVSVRRLAFQVRGHEFFIVQNRIPVRGWVMQQVVKLCAPRITDADILLYLDSDVLPVRPFSSLHFVIDGKVRFQRHPGRANVGRHLKWHRTAGRLFGLDEKDYYGADYIENIVAWRRDTCLELQQFLEERWATSWPRLLLRQFNISEYILYGLFVDEVLGGDHERHAATRTEWCLSSWDFDTTSDLVKKMAISLRDDHIAVNLQSNLGLPVQAYKELLAAIAERERSG